MSYRFVAASSSRMQFDIGALSGYTSGPLTFVLLVKRPALGLHNFGGVWNSAGSTNKLDMFASSGAGSGFLIEPPSNQFSMAWDISKWYIIAATISGSGSLPRLHYFNGTNWARTVGVSSWTARSILSSDLLYISPPLAWGGNWIGADVVCVGIKKGDSTDLQMETLSQPFFQKWKDFGFDWLVGFENSGAIVNRSNPGVGDELSRVSVSLVADPAPWSWTNPGVANPIWTGLLDDFNRADENPLTKGGAWRSGPAFTFGSDTLKVVSNMGSAIGTFGFRAWNTPVDGQVFAKVANGTSDIQFFLFQRNVTPGAGATGAYVMYIRWNPASSGYYLKLGRTDGSGITYLSPSDGGDASLFPAPNIGEKFGLRVYNADASTVRVEAYRGTDAGGMFLIRAFDDTSAGRIMTPGYAGIGLGTPGNNMDDFGANDSVSAAASVFVPRIMSIY